MMRDEFLLEADHPILAGHRVHGHRLLPGVAYIDILFQFFREAGYAFSQLELRNLSIHRPLIVAPEAPVTVGLVANERKSGEWQVRLESGEPNAAARQLLVVAEVHRRPAVEFSERLHIPAFDERTALDLEDLYATCRKRELVHSGFIKGVGRVFDLGEHLIVDARVSEEDVESVDEYLFHPTLLDACAIGSGLSLSLSADEPDKLFLPLAYEGFRASQPIRRRCRARIAKGSVRRGAEVVKLSLEFFDADGAKIAEIENAAIKAVRTPKLELESHGAAKRESNGSAAHAAGRAEPVPTPIVGPAEAIAAPGGAERFLREIFAQQLGRAADEIDTTRGYYEAGLDSAGLLALVQRIEARTGASLSPTLLFEFPTIAELARHFENAYPHLFSATVAVPTVQPSRNGHSSAEPKVRVTERPTAPESSAVTEVAVIGLAGRYPGAADMAAFWENLKAGKDSVTEIPAARWAWQEFASWKTASGKTISRWGGFLDDVDCFDAGFFRISPAEAELMDPQERHFLEMAWSAVEDAGYTPTGLAQSRTGGNRRKVGVFAGVMHKDYMLLGAEAAARGQRVPVSLNFAQIANRVSYHFNFHGPSLVVDTVCSSSLTAVHLALESIRHGECEVALAGGVNLTLHPEKYLTYGMLDMHASDGRCRSFGAGGDGYVSSEGVGVVVLKPLARAIADGDHVYATIKASVVNHVGTVSGMTVPSPVAQAEMIAECLDKAGVPAATVSYIEAHGTGTALGDPIEIHGLTKAFGAADRPFCAIGSVKSNIGHAESAAGISGLTKVILQLHHRTLVASLHSGQSNPLIDFARTPFYLQQKTEPWPQPTARIDGREFACPRRAGVSSFGATGSNAHLVLEEYVGSEAHSSAAAEREAGIRLVPLSARSEDRLRIQAANLLHRLRATGTEANSPLGLSEVAYTLQVGRVALPHRAIFAVGDLGELVAAIERFVAGDRAIPRCWHGQAKAADRLVALLATDETGKAVAANWIDQGEWEKVAEAWAAGLEIDWRRLYDGRTPRRVSLPTYPFARERYWLPRGTGSTPKSPAVAGSAGVIESTGMLMMEPVWTSKPASPVGAESAASERQIFFCNWDGSWSDLAKVRDGFGAQNVEFLNRAETLHETYERCATALLAAVQAIFGQAAAGRSLLQVVVPWDGNDDLSGSEVFLGLSGLLRAAQFENPRFGGQVILLPRATPADKVAELLAADSARPTDREIRYTQEGRAVLGWRDVQSGAPAADSCWRSDGTYLITGGLGGLGLIFAEEIARRAKGARLILTGRSPLSPAAEAKMRRLGELGAVVEYHVLDVARPGAAAALIATLEEKRHALRGVIHSAGVIRDRFIRHKTADELRDVFAPKVHGAMLLDEATRHLPLDLFVLFSSGTGAMGNVGQADYAAANGFLDAFAGWRQRRVAHGERSGRTLALGWPLWKEGGMRVGPEIEAAMKASVGMVPMSTANGLAAFYRAVGTATSHVLIGEGDVTRLRQFWLGAGLTAKAAEPATVTETNAPAGHDAVLRQLKRAFSAVTKYPIEQLQDEEPFESYGIDSIAITQLNRELADRFSQLPKTLFYEQRSLSAVAAYLLREHGAECARWTQSDPSAPAVAVVAKPAATMPGPDAPVPSRTLHRSMEPIAIIGMSGQFPGARTVTELWQNLAAGDVRFSEIPAERWPLTGFYEADRAKALAEGKSYAKWGAFLEGFAEFDAGFFKLSPREATMIDPQERLFLQEAWRALEDAGYAPSKLTESERDAFGVFCGVTKSSFSLRSDPAAGVYCHSSFASLVNRVSHAFDLRGPSVPVDAMCSSATVALHQACEALRQGDLRFALVGAVNLYLHPQSFVALAQNKLLSASSSPQVFSPTGDGFVPSEGVGAVVLKRLADAERDGDSILAVIRASAVNHGGKTHGYAVPNPAQQAAVIHRALAAAELSPEAIDYIECAANGSEMGDAIELRALQQVFGGRAQGKWRLGSVKSLLGHGEAVSGLAQLFKVVLQLRHRTLCPTRWTPTAGAEAEFEALPFAIPTHAEAWSPPERPEANGRRRAGINSFGAGGVNAHVIVEEYSAKPRTATVANPTTPTLFVLSARTDAALERSLAAWRTFVAATDDDAFDLEAIAWRLQAGRDEMKHRFACIVSSRCELLERLANASSEGGPPRIYRGVVAPGTAGVGRDHRVGRSPEAKPSVTSDRRNLDRIAAYWVAGGSVAWAQLYVQPPAAPTHPLPTYPFEQKRHWQETTAISVPAAAAAVRNVEPFAAPRSAPASTPSASVRFVPFAALEELAAATDETAPDAASKSSPAGVDEIRAVIQRTLQEMLFHDSATDLDLHASFDELGLTSVFVAPFVQRLAQEFHIELRETIVFDYSTIDRLSHYIAGQVSSGSTPTDSA